MASGVELEIRPRTAGEVLDDAWRLYLAEAPLLLALSGLFLVPVCIAVLFLLIKPLTTGGWAAPVLPAVAALLLPWSGLASGACQVLFRLRAEDKPATLRACLAATLRRSLPHAAVGAIVVLGSAPGLFCLIAALLVLSPGTYGLALLLIFLGLCWNGLILGTSSAVYPLLAAGDVQWPGALAGAMRECQRQPGKAAAVALSIQALLVIAALNLHLLIQAVLWVADSLAGLDAGFAEILLSLTNPVYLAALLLLTWLLLAPLAEAANYLAHVDHRARYEGLDLWYRVRRLLPTVQRGRAGAVLLAMGLGLGVVMPARAQDGQLEAVRAARREVVRITEQVNKADPYPGGARWAPQLRSVAAELRRTAGGRPERYGWLDNAINEFAGGGKRQALHGLRMMDERLALIEEDVGTPEVSGAGTEGASGPARTPEDVRRLLPDRSPEADDGAPTNKSPKPEEQEPKRPVNKDDPASGGAGARGPGVVPAAPVAGIGAGFWLVLAGLLLACFLVALVLFILQMKEKVPKPSRPTGEAPPATESPLDTLDPKRAEVLWQQADDLARQGNFLEAVRRLYLAVLALLSRANLVRYERTRTNGEYVRQVRLIPEAPPGLQSDFGRLTVLFDQKWYGERACDGQEYGACRALAEEIRGEVGM
jgi:hypothetical protein